MKPDASTRAADDSDMCETPRASSAERDTRRGSASQTPSASFKRSYKPRGRLLLRLSHFWDAARTLAHCFKCLCNSSSHTCCLAARGWILTSGEYRGLTSRCRSSLIDLYLLLQESISKKDKFSNSEQMLQQSSLSFLSLINLLCSSGMKV